MQKKSNKTFLLFWLAAKSKTVNNFGGLFAKKGKQCFCFALFRLPIHSFCSHFFFVSPIYGVAGRGRRGRGWVAFVCGVKSVGGRGDRVY